jgi:hypothetical protein
MDAMFATLDCQSILEMIQETPETAAIIIDMIVDLEEIDQNCLNTIRQLQARNAVAA